MSRLGGTPTFARFVFAPILRCHQPPVSFTHGWLGTNAAPGHCTGVEQVHVYIEQLAKLLEIAGVAIIFGGVLLSSVWFIRGGQKSGDWRESYEGYRANLGRGILLGLELLVGADIIGTITAPLTFTSVGLLAVIIVIRTFLSFSLETEIEGCWPWQRRSARKANGQSTGRSER